MIIILSVQSNIRDIVRLGPSEDSLAAAQRINNTLSDSKLYLFVKNSFNIIRVFLWFH